MCTSLVITYLPPSHLGERPSFVDMDQATRERLIHSLSSWHFEPHKLPEEEVIACSYILFEALYRIEHMCETVSVPLSKYLIYVSFNASCVAPTWKRPLRARPPGLCYVHVDEPLLSSTTLEHELTPISPRLLGDVSATSPATLSTGQFVP